MCVNKKTIGIVYSSFISIFYLFISCTTNEKDVDKEIIADFVDQFSYPLPIPPSLEDNDTIMNQNAIDSILKLKMKIAIFPIMESEISGSENIPETYKKLIKKNINTKYLINTNGIISKKGHYIILADTVELRKNKDYPNFDLLYHFSQIWYSQDKDRAIFELGISRSTLAGHAHIYCVEKEGTEWKIKHSIPTTIW